MGRASATKRAWRRAVWNHHAVRLVIASGLAVAVVGCGSSSGPPPPSPDAGGSPVPAKMAVAVSPSPRGRHDHVAVVIASGRATGVFGKTRRSYIGEARGERPASACVNDRDRVFPVGAQGARIRAVLDPARGEGGPEGWCPGNYRGTVTYSEAFACPSAGTCHPPPDFPTRTRIVTRFSFTVK